MREKERVSLIERTGVGLSNPITIGQHWDLAVYTHTHTQNKIVIADAAPIDLIAHKHIRVYNERQIDFCCRFLLLLLLLLVVVVVVGNCNVKYISV